MYLVLERLGIFRLCSDKGTQRHSACSDGPEDTHLARQLLNTDQPVTAALTCRKLRLRESRATASPRRRPVKLDLVSRHAPPTHFPDVSWTRRATLAEHRGRRLRISDIALGTSMLLKMNIY